MTRISRLFSKSSERKSIAAELQQAREEITARDNRIAELERDLVAARNNAGPAAAAEIERLKAQATTAENKAMEILAAQGMTLSDVPALLMEDAMFGGGNGGVDSLRKKLEQSTDPAEKYRLSNQIRSLVEKSK